MFINERSTTVPLKRNILYMDNCKYYIKSNGNDIEKVHFQRINSILER